MADRNPHLVVLTGAGVSAESGLRTFRDSNGLWEEHRVEDVATPEAFARDPELVMRFYNERRAQLKEATPNAAHRALAALESDFRVTVITQNVDNLHERGGSSRVLHLHGELTKVRPVRGSEAPTEWEGDLKIGDLSPGGVQLRPHIVWFGEAVPMIERALEEIVTADAVLIVGTSMQVYPAAGLVGYAPPRAPVLYVDPRPTISYELKDRAGLVVFEARASEGVPQAAEWLAERFG